jgi:FKBP-type peptidyl-prolyl cis-trans isomerase
MTSRLLKIIAIASIGVFALASCGKKEEPMKTYDLSASANAKFLADNKAKDGVKTLPDGLQYRVIKTGHGKGVTSGADTVSVYYKGWLISGKVFDQTQLDQPASFPAGHLIPGWVEALRMMHEGDEWQLVIPSDLGYGADGTPDGTIPPNQTLVFDMTLLTVTPEAAPTP